LKYFNSKSGISIENIDFEHALRNDKKRIETKSRFRHIRNEGFFISVSAKRNFLDQNWGHFWDFGGSGSIMGGLDSNFPCYLMKQLEAVVSVWIWKKKIPTTYFSKHHFKTSLKQYHIKSFLSFFPIPNQLIWHRGLTIYITNLIY
jgi:hypothetical protein